MLDFAAYEKKLRSDPKAGKLLEEAAASPEGQRMARELDSAAVEKALRQGDAQALKGILSRVLSTPEGRELAEKVQKAFQDR